MDAPPIPRLVDLVHAFNGVVVEQFKKKLEKLLSDSILLWRLLKLLFKIQQWRSWVGCPCFEFFFKPSYCIFINPSYFHFYIAPHWLIAGEECR